MAIYLYMLDSRTCISALIFLECNMA